MAVLVFHVSGIVPVDAQAGRSNIPAETQNAPGCVRFSSPGRLVPGAEFRFALSRGLELRLVADGLWNLGWRIEVVSGDQQPDYVWVVSPPYQTAPHLFIGAAYGVTARESARFERHLRFVLTPEDYERARRIYTDWREGRTDAAALRDHRGDLATGTLRLEITNSSIRERVRVADDVTIDAFDWIEFEGEACVPQPPVDQPRN